MRLPSLWRGNLPSGVSRNDFERFFDDFFSNWGSRYPLRMPAPEALGFSHDRERSGEDREAEGPRGAREAPELNEAEAGGVRLVQSSRRTRDPWASGGSYPTRRPPSATRTVNLCKRPLSRSRPRAG